MAAGFKISKTFVRCIYSQQTLHAPQAFPWNLPEPLTL